VIVNRHQLSYQELGRWKIRQTVEIRVRGTVQGVGFRPTVWRLACDEGLVGEVLNDGFGVLIRTTGNSGAISQFLTRLHTEAPRCRNRRCRTQVLSCSTMRTSASPEVSAVRTAHVSLPMRRFVRLAGRECSNPSDRRYGYLRELHALWATLFDWKEVPYDRVKHDDGGVSDVRRL